MIIDSHCHLDYPGLFDDLDNVIKRANQNKVKYLLSICTTLSSYEKIKIIVDKYNDVYGTLGIHPHETKDFKTFDKKKIMNLVNKNKKIIGIGETGLDYYYNHSDKDVQKKIFIEHIKAACELNLPLIVHSRNAEKDTYEILKSEKKNSSLKAIIHCFTGSSEFAKNILDLDFYISVSGIITFKNSSELAKTVSSVPIEKLLVETDSPYLSPEPYRGKKNEPSFVVKVVEKLASIKKISPEEVIKNTTNNFLKLFKLN